MGEQWKLDPDRYFDPEPSQRRVARELYDSVARLPIVSRMDTWRRSCLPTPTPFSGHRLICLSSRTITFSDALLTKGHFARRSGRAAGRQRPEQQRQRLRCGRAW